MWEWPEERMEELLPVVEKLSKRYTGGMSTSVTYEKAQELMEAVLYCIREYEAEQASVCGLMTSEGVPAETEYERGYELVVRKVKKMRRYYNTINMRFRSYGCRSLEDLMRKGIPEFFRRYDPRYAPQKSLLTFDYPILLPVGELTGIDAVEHSLSGISLEQRFLGAFEETYVCRALEAYDWNYREQFFNLCGVFLRHVLGCILAGKRLGEAPKEEDEQMLESRVRDRTPEELERMLDRLLKELVERRFGGNELLYEYLRADLRDFGTRLSHMGRDSLKKEVLFA